MESRPASVGAAVCKLCSALGPAASKVQFPHQKGRVHISGSEALPHWHGMPLQLQPLDLSRAQFQDPAEPPPVESGPWSIQLRPIHAKDRAGRQLPTSSLSIFLPFLEMLPVTQVLGPRAATLPLAGPSSCPAAGLGPGQARAACQGHKGRGSDPGSSWASVP